MTPWITVADFRARTGATLIQSDAALQATVAGAQASIVAFLGYDPTPGPVTEYYDGHGTPELVLGRRFVNAVTEVRVDRNGNYGSYPNSFGPTTVLTAGTDYALQVVGPDRTGTIVRRATVWPFGGIRHLNALATSMLPCYGCVMVTYTHGADASTPAVPPDIVDALHAESAARSAMWATGLGAELSASLDSHSRSVSALSAGNGGSGGIRSPFVSPLAETILWNRRRVAIF